MPLYDYECPKCNEKHEVYLSVNEDTKVICFGCRTVMRRIISTSSNSSKPVRRSYYCEGIGELITGPAHRARLMKKKGLSDAPKL